MIYRRGRALLSEIARQSQFALIAYCDATAALERHDPDRFWYSLQGLLAAANRLQRLLRWASDLYTAVGLAADSPLHDPGLPAVADVVAALESWNALQASDPPRLSTDRSPGHRRDGPPGGDRAATSARSGLKLE